MGSVPTERKPSSINDLSPVLLSSPFYQIHCRGDSSRWSSILNRLMKRGQQTREEPKYRQCVLITGNRNMSGLMSICFHLEMKMHLCCPDPFFWPFQNRNVTDTCTHTHTHTQTLMRTRRHAMTRKQQGRESTPKIETNLSACFFSRVLYCS